MIRSTRARRWLIALAALVFLGIAAGSAADPHAMAAGIGLSLEGRDGLSEFRAVYVGLWCATALLLIVAAVRIEEPLLGDLGALLIAGQVAGRLLSVALDGMPGARILPMFGLEAAGALALFLVRPSRAPEAPSARAASSGPLASALLLLALGAQTAEAAGDPPRSSESFDVPPALEVWTRIQGAARGSGADRLVRAEDGALRL
jgi:hypothetical protein